MLAYILGEEPCPEGEAPLYYLAMVSRGVQAPNAIFASLVLAPWKNTAGQSRYPNASLGIGEAETAWSRKRIPVALCQHWHPLRDLGYPIAWRSRKASIGADMQFTMEPDLLTVMDPLRLDHPPDLTLEEWSRCRQHPIFILMQQPEDTPATLALRHLRFLAKRVGPLPPVPDWASFLWERALDTGEATPLRTWCFDPQRDASSELRRRWPQAQRPWLSGAYLCRPHLPALQAALGDALRAHHVGGA